MEFDGKLGSYKIIKTQDGSDTVYSSFFDENCHSLSGAYEETIYNYIEGCELGAKLEKQDSITIYEVGFGVAVGPLALLNYLEEHPEFLNKKVNFHSTELDPNFVLWVLDNSEFAIKYKKELAIISKSATKVEFIIKNVNFTIWLGDARISVQNLKEQSVDCIFQDAFSPKKNPTLWTYQWFAELYRISKEEVILSTYCSSMSARASMIKAGFSLQSRKGFGVKRTCTRAFKRTEMAQENLHIEIQRHNLPYLCDTLL